MLGVILSISTCTKGSELGVDSYGAQMFINDIAVILNLPGVSSE